MAKIRTKLTKDQTTEIIGILTNLQENRFQLYRNGEHWPLTMDEEAAIRELRVGLAKFGSVISVIAE